ncbi:MAG: adenine phosphoribosyltransferase, partial [Nitrososphaerota archaeon]
MVETVLPYDGREYYELNIAGLKRNLPLLKVSDDTWIAYFDSLGDKEFISHCAKILAERLVGSEVLMTSESKGIPLVHEIAGLLNHRYYIVARKEVKPFMSNPLVVECKPITSKTTVRLSIDGRYIPRLKDKKVSIVDDIVSTRETMSALEELAKQAGAVIYQKVAILVEGATYTDVEYL